MSNASRVLSVLERAKMVCWFEETNSLAMVARRYRAEFGMDPPQLSMIKKWHQKFLETGSVNPSPVAQAQATYGSNVSVAVESASHAASSSPAALSSAAAAMFTAKSLAGPQL
ncbi:hypothetical protein Ddc_06566 [Ditylenchus destructor]|nr:hypothetical protein Ddc_06566 [Ditylenchus destructor]